VLSTGSATSEPNSAFAQLKADTQAARAALQAGFRQKHQYVHV